MDPLLSEGQQLERYRATMRKVRLAMRGQLDEDEIEDLEIASEAGDRWFGNRVRKALGKPILAEDE
jgi:hypothetical protein